MSRTVKILGAMIAGITLVSGALLALEPGPSFRPSIQLAAYGPEDVETALFNTAPSRMWKKIVIHDSRGIEGGQAELDDVRRRVYHMENGAGYHFVLRRDGDRLELCSRWRDQLPGAFIVHDKAATAWNEESIGICLIGNAQRQAFDPEQLKALVRLVGELQARYRIPANQVYVDLGTANTRTTGGTFPLAAFRAQLAK